MSKGRFVFYLENKGKEGLEFDSFVKLSQDAEELLKALKQESANERHPIHTGELYQTGEYVIVTPRELGFEQPERPVWIELEADKHDLYPCTYEAPFLARAIYVEQPEGESVLVVTYCIEDRGDPFLFTLESDQGFLYIDVTHGDDGVSEPMPLIQPDAKLLFQRKLVKFHEGDCLLD